MTHDQDLARELGETLHRRADALHDTPLDLMDVRGRATTIRRRRHTAVGLAAATAVAAVVLPLSLLPSGGDDRVVEPRPVDTPTVTPLDDPVPLDPRSAPEGPQARISYVDSDREQLVTPAGTYDLPEAYRQIVPDGGGGWIALSADTPSTTGFRVVILDGDFRVVDSSGGMTSSMAVRQDGGHVAVATWSGDGTWTLVTNPVPRTEDYTFIDLATRSSEQAVHTAIGYLPDDRVVVEATDPGSGRSSYQVVAPDGTKTDFGGFNRVVATSSVTGLVGGQTEFLGDGSCSAVLDPLSADQGPVWETCEHSLGAFSPDGRYVVGLAPYYDGTGSPTVGILDAATGEPLVDFVSSNDPESVATVGDVAWEDATTLLATVNQGTEEFLVRLTADGGVERLDAMPDPGGENARFWFAAGPGS
jgi:hypothetical protein